MRKITVDVRPNHLNNSFLIVRKSNPYFVQGEEYMLTDISDDKIKPIVITSKRTIEQSSITQFESYLDSNTNTFVFADILKSRGIKVDDKLDVLVLTEKFAVR